MTALFVIAAVTFTCWAVLTRIKSSPWFADPPRRTPPFWQSDTSDIGD